MKIRIAFLAVAVLLLAAVFTIASTGFARITDASDPDPGYYKGKLFIHKRMG